MTVFGGERAEIRGRELGDFFAMGGYGAYVWVAYGTTLLGLALLFVWSWFGARARQAELDRMRQLARGDRRAPGSATLHRATGDKDGNDGTAMPAAGAVGLHPGGAGGTGE